MQSLFWEKLKVTGDVPTPRSGHSFTKVGTRHLLFGGIGCTDSANPSKQPENLTCRGGSWDFAINGQTLDDAVHTCHSHQRQMPISSHCLIVQAASQRRSTICMSLIPVRKNQSGTSFRPQMLHRPEHAMLPLQSARTTCSYLEALTRGIASVILGFTTVRPSYGLNWNRQAINTRMTKELRVSYVRVLGHTSQPRSSSILS